MNKSKIKFKYKFNEYYNPVYVNGAHGGINPKREIVINFYLERSPLPVSQEYEIQNNKLVNETSTPEDLKMSFIRYVENGIILSLESAKDIHKWIGKHIDKLEELDKNGTLRTNKK